MAPKGADVSVSGKPLTKLVVNAPPATPPPSGTRDRALIDESAIRATVTNCIHADDITPLVRSGRSPILQG